MSRLNQQGVSPRPSGTRGLAGRLRTIVAALLLAPASGAPVMAQDSAIGDFLTGRIALSRGDYAFSAARFGALMDDPARAAFVIDDVIYASVSAGEFATALAFAQSNPGVGRRARVILFADAVQRGDWHGALALSRDFPPPTRWLLEPWIHWGAGDVDAARRVYAGIGSPGQPRLPPSQYAELQFSQNLLETLAGEAETRPEWQGLIYGSAGVGKLDARAALAAASGLSGPEATQALLEAAGPVEDVAALRQRLRAADGRPDHWRRVADAQAGIAEGFLALSQPRFDQRRRVSRWSVFDLRIAQQLRPDDPFIGVALGHALHESGDVDGALAQFRAAGISGRAAELNTLLAAGRTAEARERAAVLVREAPEEADALYTRASLLRRLGAYAEAREGIDLVMGRIEAARAEIVRTDQERGWSGSLSDRIAASAGLSPSARARYLLAHFDLQWANTRLWRLHFERGISAERIGDWAAAEADLLQALELAPENPLVANYLGYSWVDQGINLHRGLELLERAAAERPHDGNIVDSVGWARYRLGDYAGALKDLERAVVLQPAAAEIYDHLGDALWQTGRPVEARFQWRRVLELEADEALRRKAQMKLEHGLDGAAD